MDPRNKIGKRWLLVRNGGIGDTVLLSCVLQTIRQGVPDAWIELLGVEERVNLLVGPHLADRASASDRFGLENLFGEDTELSPATKHYFADFDVILYYSAKPSRELENKLRVRDGQVVRVYPALPSDAFAGHITDHYFMALDGILPVVSRPLPRIEIGEGERSEARRRLEREDNNLDVLFLAMHVGAGSAKKLAPLDYFISVVQAFLQRVPTRVLLAQGPADEERMQECLPRLRSIADVMVIRDEPLRVLAALIAECDLFVGNDSGVTHIAAAVGCPTVALFTASNPAVWSPLGEQVRMIHIT